MNLYNFYNIFNRELTNTYISNKERLNFFFY